MIQCCQLFHIKRLRLLIGFFRHFQTFIKFVFFSSGLVGDGSEESDRTAEHSEPSTALSTAVSHIESNHSKKV